MIFSIRKFTTKQFYDIIYTNKFEGKHCALACPSFTLGFDILSAVDTLHRLHAEVCYIRLCEHHLPMSDS